MKLYAAMARVANIALHKGSAACGDIQGGDHDLHAQLLDAIRNQDASRATAAVNALLDHTRVKTIG